MNNLEKHTFDNTKSVAHSIGISEEDLKVTIRVISRHAKKRMPDAKRAGRIFRDMLEKNKS